MAWAKFDSVSVTYHGAAEPVLRPFSLSIEEGEFLLVSGSTGSGKSTLLKCLNGLVPHFTGGTVAGNVVVGGRNTRDFAPRDLADLVGYVGQDPAATFVADHVEDELAYTMENLGVPPAMMRRRVEEVIDLLALEPLRHRKLLSLSGGEQQRVAIGAVLTASPRLLVLDEPTSSLDPLGAEEVLSSLARLCHDGGLTIVVAEHRLERIVHLAERLVLVEADGSVWDDEIASGMKRSPLVPPIVQMGRTFNWSPLPLSIRNARRAAAPLRTQLAHHEQIGELNHMDGSAPSREHNREYSREYSSQPALTFTQMTTSWESREVVNGLTLSLGAGEILALMGRNGSGKSTVLACAAGQKLPTGGTVRLGEHDPAALKGRQLLASVGLVPQDPGLLLYTSSVEQECVRSDMESGLMPGTTAARLEVIHPQLDIHAHPRDLSEGQRLALALAVVTAHQPQVLLLDEPTRGCDYLTKARLAALLREMVQHGVAVLLATHDVELAAGLADRVAVLSHGELIANDCVREVVRHSPTLAPQVAKILSPLDLLTMDEVTEALTERGTLQ